MYTHLTNDIKIIQVPFAPFTDGVNRDLQLSENLTFGELFDATKVIDKQELWDYGVPHHKNFLEVFELLRRYTKKPLYLGSAFRSYDWEIKQGRVGNSQHIEANAYDFNGTNLKAVLDEALESKNHLYHELRKLGINAFGRYDWGYHLDFRQNKPNNDIYYWDESKKKVKTQC